MSSGTAAKPLPENGVPGAARSPAGEHPGAPSTDQEALAARQLIRGWAPAPTLAELIRHAQLFGTDQVYETAEGLLAESELVQLSLELNRIDGKPTGRRFSGKAKRRKRLSKEQKIKAAEYLRSEGAPNSRIATHLGVGVRRVEQLFQEARKLRQDAREAPEPEVSAHDTPRDVDTEISGEMQPA